MSADSAIILPSFLRRIMRAYALKAEIRQLGCDLHRIGRSRNWRLIGTTEQFYEIIHIIETSDEQSWLWLAKKLRQETQKLTHDHLLNIAKKNDGITINELIAKTDCTVAEARKVIDELEWMDD